MYGTLRVGYAGKWMNMQIHRMSANSDLDPDHFLAGGRQMGARMRSLDWAATPLGPPEHWPQSLRTSISICLNCKFAIVIWWGKDLVMLYNDDYVPMLGNYHPRALGAAGKDVNFDTWPIVGSMLESVLNTSIATESHDLQLLMERNGYLEETYFTFSNSPIRDESGGVAGVFSPVSETTQRVLGERRMRALRDLAAQTSAADNAQAACSSATKTLEGYGYDIPFALIYRIGEGSATLVCCANAEAGSEFAPETILFEDSDASEANPSHSLNSHWPVAETARTGTATIVGGLAARFGNVVTGGWQDAPNSAYILPILLPGEDKASAVLVAGINPRRALDDDYRSFYSLVAGQIASAVAAGARQERERSTTQARIDALAQMFNNAPAFIAVLQGPEHIFELANPNYLQLVHHRDVIGKTVREAVPEAEGQGFFELLDEVYTSNRAIRRDGLSLSLQRKSAELAERCYVTFVYQPITGPDGNPSGIFVLGIDVTENVMAQDALRRSEKLAATGRLAATIAHEINNPLEAITNLLYLVRTETPSGMQSYIDLAEHELGRVAHITKQTLAFYKESVAPAWFDLSSTIASTLVFYARHAQAKGIALSTSFAPGCGMLGIEGEVKQVFSNLIANAIDAMNGQPGVIKIRTRHSLRHSTFLISDNGQGIDPKNLTRIWQPFFTTKESVGTGLGLWVTKEIVEKHNAAIRVRTRCEGAHRGTTFVVDFSYAPMQEPAE